MAEWKKIVCQLAHPIKVGELSLTELTLFDPDVDAMEAIDELGMVEGQPISVKQMRGAIAALSRQPLDLIGKLHREDFTAVMEKAVPLLSDASATSRGADSELPKTETPSSPTSLTG